jgi:hypothetical protein
VGAGLVVFLGGGKITSLFWSVARGPCWLRRRRETPAGFIIFADVSCKDWFVEKVK